MTGMHKYGEACQCLVCLSRHSCSKLLHHGKQKLVISSQIEYLFTLVVGSGTWYEKLHAKWERR